MAMSPSLFDAPVEPVADAAANWLTATLLGSVAIGLCVIAVAIVGLMLMTGRLAVREAAKVAIGCFVLLGAPVLAAGLQGAAGSAGGTIVASPPAIYAPSPLPERPPAHYDPYAGASLRRD